MLDSHAFVWFVAGDPRCSQVAREAICDDGSRAHVSAATGWELATKHRIGKWAEAGSILDDFAGVIERNGFLTLAISVEHGLFAGALLGAHKDPFDRMLAAQARLDDMVLVTADAAFEAFGTRTLW